MSARKRGLGRGLDALLEVESASERTLPLDRLHPNRFQPRESFGEEALRELSESIRAQGVVQPIVVTPRADGEYTIIAGERRWRAARQAGLDAAPVVVRDVKDDRQLLEMALVENLQRADLNPIEEARAFRTLRQAFGLTQEEVARRVGKSRSAVANALRLLKLPDEVKGLLADGSLTAGQARPLLALDDLERQLELAHSAAAGRLSARDLEARAAGAPRRKARPRPVIDADTAAAAEKLTRRLQAKVEIRRHGRGGTVRIAFHSEEELIRLYEMLIEAGGRR